MPANYNLRCRWDQTFRLPRDFSPYDTQLQAGAVARMEMTFANGYVLEFSSLSGDGKDGTFVYDSYKKGWFICPLNKLAALYLTFGGSSKALSATWAARLEKDGASQIVMSGRAIWSAPDITETGDSSSTGTGTGTFGQTVFVDGETDGVTPPLPIDFSTAVAMATQLAQDWATKTSAEVVAGQGYGAKKYAIDAEAAANSAIQVLAGAGSDQYTVNGVDAFANGAVLSFPKGLSVLNGNKVPTSSFITPSTAAKTVFNPDGTARRTSANELAQSWRNGTRFGFLEANGFENLVTTPETPSGWFGGSGSVASTANGYRGIFNRATITSGATGASVLGAGKVMTAGQKLSFSATFKAGTLDKPSFGFFNITAGSFAAADANCYARIKSGPGSLVKGASNALWHIEGASADTEIEAWCIASASCTLYLLVYDFEALLGSPSAGKTFDICCPQVGVGGPRSYVPNNTPCAGDIWQLASGLAAQQLGQNSTFIIRARVLQGNVAFENLAVQLLGDNQGSMLYAIMTGRLAGAWTSGQVYNFSASTAADNLAFGARLGVAFTTSKSGIRKMCINGGAVVTDNHSQYTNDVLSLFIGNGAAGYCSDLEVEEIVSMAAFVDNDDALRVHARPYA